jgi:hypothetical protein
MDVVCASGFVRLIQHPSTQYLLLLVVVGVRKSFYLYRNYQCYARIRNTGTNNEVKIKDKFDINKVKLHVGYLTISRHQFYARYNYNDMMFIKTIHCQNTTNNALTL